MNAISVKVHVPFDDRNGPKKVLSGETRCECQTKKTDDIQYHLALEVLLQFMNEFISVSVSISSRHFD